MPRIKTKHLVIVLIFAFLLIFTGLALDNRLQVTHYDLRDSRIPEAFDGCVIAQLSDMHCRVFGQNQSQLISTVESGQPDFIMLTGDIIDAYILDYNSVSVLFDGLTKIAPVYAVSGNHEDQSPVILKNMDRLYLKYGVHYLEDRSATIEKNGASIGVFGANDRSFLFDPLSLGDIPTVDNRMFSILLFHRASEFDAVRGLGYSLVLSGHTHGGLIRLPFVGGIISPDGIIDFSQKYTGGIYTVNGTTLISNRGMAPSHGVPRIFNRPEVVFITLHNA